MITPYRHDPEKNADHQLYRLRQPNSQGSSVPAGEYNRLLYHLFAQGTVHRYPQFDDRNGKTQELPCLGQESDALCLELKTKKETKQD